MTLLLLLLVPRTFAINFQIHTLHEVTPENMISERTNKGTASQYNSCATTGVLLANPVLA